jgi:hypothetical protein
MENYINFVKNRNSKKIKNSARIAYWFLALLFGLIAPWKNATIVEKIILIILVWVYLFFVLIYASNERMKNLYKKNRFYGWSEYGISLMFLYSICRVQFNDFNWSLFTVLILNAVLQTVLWILGVKKNIITGEYNDISKDVIGINCYLILSIIFHIITLFGINIIYISNSQINGVVMALFNIMYLLHWVFYIGLSFIYQNFIIKKFDLFYLLNSD